jgi:hypothetical protein
MQNGLLYELIQQNKISPKISHLHLKYFPSSKYKYSTSQVLHGLKIALSGIDTKKHHKKPALSLT